MIFFKCLSIHITSNVCIVPMYTRAGIFVSSIIYSPASLLNVLLHGSNDT